MSQLNLVRTLPEDVWRTFVSAQPGGNIFHTPEMYRVFECVKNYRPSMWAVVNRHQQPLALLTPVEISVIDHWPLRKPSTRSVVYGGPLSVPSPAGNEALALLLQSYNQTMKGLLLFTELRNQVDTAFQQPVLQENGFEYEDHLNFLIDLTVSPDELWRNIRSSARRNIKKAKKRDVIIKELTEPEQVQSVYAVLKQVYRRLQVPLADESLFKAAFEELYPRHMIRIVQAEVEGHVAGVLCLLLYRQTVYYWYTGSLRAYSAYRPNDFLVWHTLDWGQKNGFALFDFGGGGKPDEEYGVRDFKAKYGGQLVNFGRNTSVHAPLFLKISHRSYELLRKFL